MSNKFTEEQFKKLVKIQEKYFSNNLLTYGMDGENPNQAISEYDNKLRLFIWVEDLLNEAIAIMNPVTREWAHDKFVEKEKKYYWTSKDGTKSGKMHRRLYKGGFSKIHDIYIEDNYPKSENEELTESEVMSSVYNQEMFDKEEV